MMRMTRWPWCWGRWPAVAVQRCLVPPFSVSRACGIDLVSMFEQGEESLMFVGEQLREDTRSQSSRCQESCYILEYIFSILSVRQASPSHLTFLHKASFIANLLNFNNTFREPHACPWRVVLRTSLQLLCFYASTSHLFRCHVLSLALLASDLVFRPQPDLLLISENLLISFCIAIL